MCINMCVCLCVCAHAFVCITEHLNHDSYYTMLPVSATCDLIFAIIKLTPHQVLTNISITSAECVNTKSSFWLFNRNNLVTTNALNITLILSSHDVKSNMCTKLARVRIL